MFISGNLLCNIENMSTGSTFDDLDLDLGRLTKGALTYEIIAQILHHKYGTTDLKRKVDVHFIRQFLNSYQC